MKKRILSGMRPTGALHLGHLVGAIENWVKLQEKFECFFMVADWHALMSEYKNAASIKDYVYDNVATWIACGINPNKSAIFVQSDIKEHLYLNTLLACITPLGWLERCPTYKEQLKELKDKDIHTYAFLGYPVLQASDILLYKADSVPVGQDQLPHLELTREIARRANHLYKANFVEPHPIISKVSKLLGLDGRKMSKSYNNTINFSDSREEVLFKVQKMFTDPKRIKLTDSGHPEACNVYKYHSVFAKEGVSELFKLCQNAKIGCTQCKKNLGGKLYEEISPIIKKRKDLLKNKTLIKKVLKQGKKKAETVASKTYQELKKVINLDYA